MADQNLNNMTVTWNSGGTTFSAVKMNVTDTASAAASLLLQFQVGGSDKFKVGKDGTITSAANLVLAGNATITGNVTISGTLTAAGIVGTVAGPASATDNAIARFNGATGKVLQNSGVIISDTNAITGVVGLTSTDDITASSADVIASNFLAGTFGVFSRSAAGSIFLRPNGKASTVGQVRLNTDGSLSVDGSLFIAGALSATGAVSGTTGTFSGAVSGTTGAFSSTVTASGDITAASADMIASNFLVGASGIYAKAAAGTMLFRPNGKASATGQMSIATSGDVGINGTLTVVDGAIFQVSSSEISRITSTAIHIGKNTGNLTAAGTSFFASGASNGLFQCTRDSDIVGQFNVINPVGTETVLEFMTSGTAKGSITILASTTAYNTSSDRRLKENPRSFDAGEILDRLKVYHFDWKAGGSGYGVYAQEAYEVFPDAIFKGDEEKMWQADYSKFVPLLLAEVKDVRQRLAAAGL